MKILKQEEAIQVSASALANRIVLVALIWYQFGWKWALGAWVAATVVATILCKISLYGLRFQLEEGAKQG